MTSNKDDSRFAYKTMASVVVKQDRSEVQKEEATGESQRVTSNELKGIMGAGLKRADLSKEISKKKKKAAASGAVEAPSSKDQTKYYDELLNENLSTALYVPQTKSSERAWDSLLTQVSDYLPDVPRDVLRNATEEVLILLKNPDRNPNDKKRDVELILSGLSEDDFRRMGETCDLINDYTPASVAAAAKSQADAREEGGIAVVFEEESEEDDESVGELEEQEIDPQSSEEEEQDPETKAEDESNEISMKQTKKSYDLLDPKLIDAYWLQREVSANFANSTSISPEDVQQFAESALQSLSDIEMDDASCENRLVAMLGFDCFELIKVLLRNRWAIAYCTKLSRAKDEAERERILEEEIREKDVWIYNKLRGIEDAGEEKKKKKKPGSYQPVLREKQLAEERFRPNMVVDIDALLKKQALTSSQLLLNKKVVLPKGSWHRQEKHFEEVHVRPLKPKPFDEKERLVQIDSLPAWMRPAFKGMKELNRVQSRIYGAATNVDKDFNMLVCAPTGAGKTNVAMLAVMREVARFVKEDGVTIDRRAMKERLKIVYVAPMKALVQEVVANFTYRLTEAFDIVVKEFSGDRQLSRGEISETQIIVTTPEKWDVVTRKSGDRAFTQFVKLVIIDEIHLLHDSRGAVLEAIIARTLRASIETKNFVRILGISATLPNYLDVAALLRVPPEEGLFFFDNSYRPVPLQQIYVGISEKKPLKRMQLMDQICYEKTLASVKQNQVLIFVHSRKDTVKTAKLIRNKALEADTLASFVSSQPHSKEVLDRVVSEEGPIAERALSPDLKDLLPFGFAVHHAGLRKTDRNLVEDLFADGHIRVLVSTATLAWGVNLPAHTVIIKGTQVYDPEAGKWGELSQLDVLQMLGRAGRPQFDTEGEGIILTSLNEMQFYLSLLNEQLPLESQLVRKLCDNLNAEIANGALDSLKDCVRWLAYTFLYIRAVRNPLRYDAPLGEDEPDELEGRLLQWRVNLVHSALLVLDKYQLVRYDRRTGQVASLPMGRIASHYYLSPESMDVFAKLVEPSMTDVDFLRVIASSTDFRQIVPRSEEKREILKLLDQVPVPIKEEADNSIAKVNALLQAYISRSALDGFALSCDLIFVNQSAGRISRALFEICMHKEWASAARRALDLCTMIDRQLWRVQSPLRQFKTGVLSEDVLDRLERKNVPWSRFFEYTPTELGALVRDAKLGNALHELIHKFPKLDLSASIQPISPSSVRVDLSIMSDFQFDSQLYGNQLLFWVFVQDGELGERVLHAEPFILKQRYNEEEHVVSFVVSQLPDPTPAFLHIRVDCDRFLHSRASCAVPLMKIAFPSKAEPFLELLDLTALTPAQLITAHERSVYSALAQFTPVQTQTYHVLRETDFNAVVCAPSGKTICAEFAIFRAFEVDADARVLCLCPRDGAEKLARWVEVFAPKKVVQMTGDDSIDLAALQDAHLVVSSARVWEIFSRRWKQKSRKFVTEISSLVVDDLHCMGDGSKEGAACEVVVSRMIYAAAQLNRVMRVVALGNPITNAEDVASWIGAKKNCFNFSTSARMSALEISIKSFGEPNADARLGLMVKPAFQALRGAKKGIVFVPTRKQARMTAIDFGIYADAESSGVDAARVEERKQLCEGLVDRTLRDCIVEHGVAYLHEGLSPEDAARVQSVFAREASVRTLICTAGCVYRVKVVAEAVVVMGTSRFEGKDRRYNEYSIHEVFKMLNKAEQRVLILLHDARKAFYKKFLHQAMPLESALNQWLPDFVLADVVSKTIQNKQDALDWMTWTFFFRRCVKNPAFYGFVSPADKDISAELSELVDKCVDELIEAKAIEAAEGEEDALKPLNLGMIASHYDVNAQTMELFSTSLQAKTKLKGVLEILSSASEFTELASTRAKEEEVLEKLMKHLPIAVSAAARPSDAHTKVNILLQTHFQRTHLGQGILAGEQRDDISAVLAAAPKLLHALLDVSSSFGWLRPALCCVELCQMVVQGMWGKQSSLLQLPIDEDMIERFRQVEVRSVYDLIQLDDSVRESILSDIRADVLARVADFCNTYPSMQVDFQVNGQPAVVEGGVRAFRVSDSANVEAVVTLKTDALDDDEFDDVVRSDRYPHSKKQNWWVICGDEAGNILYAIKRCPAKGGSVKLNFSLDDNANKALKLYVVCDSYIGCDQEFAFVLKN